MTKKKEPAKKPAPKKKVYFDGGARTGIIPPKPAKGQKTKKK